MSRRTLGTVKHIDPSKQADVITTRGDLVRGSSGAVAERLAVGSANEVVTSDGTDASWGAVPNATDTVVGGLETAIQAEQETGSATDKIVTPGRQQFHPSSPKAWANLNGTGTAAIRSSYNCTLATDHGTGNYSFTITTNFSDADYTFVFGAWSEATGGANFISVNNAETPTASTLRVQAADHAGTLRDSDAVNFAAFGDQ